MKKIWMLISLLLLLLFGACSQNEVDQSTTPDGQAQQSSTEQPIKEPENELPFELLMQLDFLPHEVGTTISLIQNEQLYNAWADIFEFKSIPTIDFSNEEVLFITTYTDGCGRVLDSIKNENGQLVAKLDYPEHLKKQKEIVCTEIAMPVTFVVKLDKSGLTHGTLKDGNHTLLENELLIQ